MKLGVGLVVWGCIVAIGVAFFSGISFVTAFGEGDFVFIFGVYFGSWIVLGGIPLFFGIRRIRSEYTIHG